MWTEDEIRRTYGLEDESSKDIPQQKKDDVVKEILKLVDSNHDGKITLLEWTGFRNAGGKLPDFGVRDFFLPALVRRAAIASLTPPPAPKRSIKHGLKLTDGDHD